MPSALMPKDSDAIPLHQKLLNLHEDVQLQYNLMLKLNISEKTKINAKIYYNDCVEKFLLLPQQARLVKLAQDNSPDLAQNRHLYRNEYCKFLDFYSALEVLLVRHLMEYQYDEGNEYLKKALDKMSDTEKETILAMPEKTGMTPRSPHTPHSDSTSSKEEVVLSPRKRANSHSAPLSWLTSPRNTEQKKPSPRERSHSELKY